MNCFHQQQLAFVSVKKDSFCIGQVSYSALHVLIQKIQPIRKYFKGGKLI